MVCEEQALREPNSSSIFKSTHMTTLCAKQLGKTMRGFLSASLLENSLRAIAACRDASGCQTSGSAHPVSAAAALRAFGYRPTFALPTFTSSMFALQPMFSLLSWQAFLMLAIQEPRNSCTKQNGPSNDHSDRYYNQSIPSTHGRRSRKELHNLKLCNCSS